MTWNQFARTILNDRLLITLSSLTVLPCVPLALSPSRSTCSQPSVDPSSNPKEMQTKIYVGLIGDYDFIERIVEGEEEVEMKDVLRITCTYAYGQGD